MGFEMTTPVEREKLGSSVLADSIAFVRELLGRLLDRLCEFALPITMLASCQSPVDPSVRATPAPVTEVVAPQDAAAKDEPPKALGKFDITFYYVVGEEE